MKINEGKQKREREVGVYICLLSAYATQNSYVFPYVLFNYFICNIIWFNFPVLIQFFTDNDEMSINSNEEHTKQIW